MSAPLQSSLAKRPYRHSSSTRRGTASIEALMVLTTLVLVWAGVTYMTRLLDGKLKAQADARSCAWEISLNGCSSIPPECEAEAEEVEPSDKTESLERSQDEMDAGDTEGDEVRASLKTEIDGLFKKRISVSGSREVHGSKLLKVENAAMPAGYSLPCNSKPHTLGDMAKNFLDKFI